MSSIYIYQIFYDDSSRAALDPGFLPLDNLRNERPDWREYHPIRDFLLGRTLESDAFYGFLSPRFASKTGLGADRVKSFVMTSDADVILFCPFFDQSAFFLNIFEQGEIHHRGLTQAAQDFLGTAGVHIDLKTMINDSSNTIFSNYIVARPSFWQTWLELGEKLFAYVEQASSENSSLRAPTAHRGAEIVPLKVFLMERLATVLLATRPTLRTSTYDPLSLPMSGSSVSRFGRQLLICDALKMAARRHANPRYIQEYFAMKKFILANAR
jgi:hypothetical protein